MPRKPKTSGDHYHDAFPSNLRELMRVRKIKQEDLIGVLGVSARQSVTGYINGDTIPTIDKLASLSEFFGVSSDWLLGRAETPSPDESIQGACKTTGLSETAIANIKGSLNPDVLSMLLESDEFMNLLNDIAALRFQKSVLEDSNTYLREFIETGYDENFEPYSFSSSYEENMLKLRLYRYEIEKAFSALLERLIPTAELISESRELLKGAGLNGKH